MNTREPISVGIICHHYWMLISEMPDYLLGFVGYYRLSLYLNIAIFSFASLQCFSAPSLQSYLVSALRKILSRKSFFLSEDNVHFI